MAAWARFGCERITYRRGHRIIHVAERVLQRIFRLRYGTHHRTSKRRWIATVTGVFNSQRPNCLFIVHLHKMAIFKLCKDASSALQVPVYYRSLHK